MPSTGPLPRAACALALLLGAGAAGWAQAPREGGRWSMPGKDYAASRMPAFGGHLPAESIWRLVACLRSLAAEDTLSTTAW